MKQINLKLIALSILSVMVLSGTALADGPYNIGQIMGTPRKQGEPVRVYKLVRFASRNVDGPNIASNDVVAYDTNSDDSVTVRLANSLSADTAIAGIADMTILTADSASTTAFSDAGKRNWGYIIDIHWRRRPYTLAPYYS